MDLVGGELPQAHGAAGVELLGADADLGSEAELLAIGESGRGVDDHCGGVDLAGEAVGGGQVLVTMASVWPEPKRLMWSMALVEVGDDGDAHHQVEELLGRSRRRWPRSPCGHDGRWRRRPKLDPGERGGRTGQELGGDAFVHDAATRRHCRPTGRCVLALTTIVERHVEVGRLAST